MNNYSFRNLVLLVGTNPLPNLVVADYFLKNNLQLKRIWLVHSEQNEFQAGTIEHAENLEKVLKDRRRNDHNLQFPLEKIALPDVSLSNSIRRNIKTKMISNIDDSEKVHLNYTGGTKSMSTHVYWILKDAYENKDISFSYLDARNFRLISDDKGILENDLRKKVFISFKEMIRLHGFQRKNKPKEFIFTDSLKVLQKFIEDDQLDEFYDISGYSRNMFLNDKGMLAEKVCKLSKSSLEVLERFNPGAKLLDVIHKMPQDYRLFDENGKFNKSLKNKNFSKAVKFLDGEWLEHHIECILGKITTENKIMFEKNWVIKKPEWGGQLDFEIDVILINGYQLTGISCTTDSAKKLCKNKGFEIIHRTRQIGGDEARAVLITKMDTKTKDAVGEELEVHTGGTEKNILVLGKKDLKESILTRQIKQFILAE